VADIDSITFTLPSFASSSSKVIINYSGSTATVSIPSSLASKVTSTISGANVVITSTEAANEIEYQLQGSSSDGSFTFNGAYKCTMTLNGLSLTSTTGAAIDIECGKRIALRTGGRHGQHAMPTVCQRFPESLLLLQRPHGSGRCRFTLCGGQCQTRHQHE
jgi:hypothetical protein